MKKTLVAGTVIYLLASLTVGFLGSVTSPAIAYADGNNVEPPSKVSPPPDTTVTSPGSTDFIDSTTQPETLSLLDYAKMALQVIL